MSERREFWVCAGCSFESYEEAIAFMHGVDRDKNIVHVREVLPGDDELLDHCTQIAKVYDENEQLRQQLAALRFTAEALIEAYDNGEAVDTVVERMDALRSALKLEETNA